MTQAFNTLKDWRERGYAMRHPPKMIIGYDPSGDGEDRDALILVAREEHQRGEPWDPDFAVMTAFRVLMAKMLPYELEFPDKVAQLLRLHMELLRWHRKAKTSGHVFAVEANGVGHGMASTLRSKLPQKVASYTTVGNATNTAANSKGLVMPRLAGLDNLRILAETHVLKVAPDAEGRDQLASQLRSFVWRAPGRPEAIEGQHDDLVMALAGACWIGTRVIPPDLRQKRVEPVRMQ